MEKESRLFQNLLERKLSQPEKDDDDDTEDEGESDDEGGEEINILGIDSDVWAYVILSYFNVFEVLKFFHVSKGFYVIACLTLQNRKANSNRILSLVMEKNPSEIFLMKLIKWDSFDTILNNHIIRYAVRKGYFETTRYLCKHDSDCSIRDWILDVLEQMIIQLEKKSGDDEGLFEGYVELLNDFKNEIRWDSMSSAEAFNILCVNREMHEYVRSKMSSQEIDYSNLFLISCEYEYINNLSYFFKNNFQQYISDRTFGEGWKKILEKERGKSANLEKIVVMIADSVPAKWILSTFEKIVYSGMKGSKFWILSHFLNSNMALDLRKRRYRPRIYEILKKICGMGFYKLQNRGWRWGAYELCVVDDFIPENKDEIIRDLAKQMFEKLQLDPSFENSIFLTLACQNGNLPLFRYFYEQPLVDPSFNTSLIKTVATFGMEKESDLRHAVSLSKKVVDNYIEILRTLVRDERCDAFEGTNKVYRAIRKITNKNHVTAKVLDALKLDPLVKKDADEFEEEIRRDESSQKEIGHFDPDDLFF